MRRLTTLKLVYLYFVLSLVLLGCGTARRSPQELVSDLAGDYAVQSYRLLERSQDPDFRQAVVAGLSDSNARVRSQCARIVGGWRDVDFVELLTLALRDKNLVVRREAARSLLLLLDTDQVVEILKDPQADLKAKQELASWLLRDSTELAHEGFFRWLTDTGHSIGFQVALWDLLREIVGRDFKEEKIAVRELVPVLRERREFLAARSRALALDKSEPEALRCSALAAYAALARERSVRDLIPLLTDVKHGHRFRDAVLVALGHSQSEQAVFPLCQVFRDGSNPLSSREAALTGLRLLWDYPAAFATLEEALRDSDPRLRRTAARMTKGLASGPFRPQLESALARELNASVAEELSNNLNPGQMKRRKRSQE